MMIEININLHIMTNSNIPLRTGNLQRDDNGQFSDKGFGEKKIRTMRLSDEAWNNLGIIAEQQGKSRADLIEEFARAEIHNKLGTK